MGRITGGLRRASSTLSWVNAHLPKSPTLYSDRFAHTHEIDWFGVQFDWTPDWV